MGTNERVQVMIVDPMDSVAHLNGLDLSLTSLSKPYMAKWKYILFINQMDAKIKQIIFKNLH